MTSERPPSPGSITPPPPSSRRAVMPERTIGMIVAVSPEGVIGLNGTIPWNYPGDLKRFKRVTTGATVVMGRLTWESIGQRPLPGRRNVVVTSRKLSKPPSLRPEPAFEYFSSLPTALRSCQGPVWIIGGARIYAEAMPVAALIDVTYVPDTIDDPAAVRFPPIDPADWIEGPLLVHEDEPALRRRVYTRRPR